MESTHFLNGKFVLEKDLLISPRDLGYSRGYAVFDFMVTYQHRPYLLQKHIDRLFSSAEAIALFIPWSKEEISSWIMKTLEINMPINGEKVIRISISGGPSFTLAPPSVPTILITVDPHIPCPLEHYMDGVTAKLVEFQRYQPQAKTNNYIEAIRCLRKPDTTPYIDEIVYHSSGMVREGSRSNVFAVINGKLVTPKTGILEGMTRSTLLSILELSIPVEVEDFSVDAFLAATEVFITATGKEVMPIIQIDDISVGDGNVGPITKEVMRQHHDYVRSNQW